MTKKIISKARYRNVLQVAKFYHDEPAALALIEDYDQLINSLADQKAAPQRQIIAVKRFFTRHPAAPIKKLSTTTQVERIENNYETHPFLELLNDESRPWPLTAARRSVVASILAHGVCPNLAGTGFIEPLGCAVDRNDTPTARLLLEHGADPMCLSATDLPVFFVATAQLNFSMVNLLLDYKVDINWKYSSYKHCRHLNNYNALGHLYREVSAYYNPEVSSTTTSVRGSPEKIVKMIKLLHARGLDHTVPQGRNQEPLSKIASTHNQGRDILGTNWVAALENLEKTNTRPLSEL